MTMDGERWRLVKEIFTSACPLDGDERTALLGERCGADDALRAEVESLLSRHGQQPGFLETPAPAMAARWLADAPARLGAYRIVRPLGSGGMADVYLAERADGQFEKQAAAKIIKPGQYRDNLSSRFRIERQLLASLDHPNIVRLLDGGLTEDGRPYLIMDYVDGAPIAAYVAGQNPSLQERLTLFLKVCDAVGYAHSRSIVHRDIKPSNILVTREGVPKLLDFGIAKLVEPQEASGPLDVTQTSSRYFTLEYASPEQVRGERVTAASDIYSLGLVLYQILTDRRPFNLAGLTPYQAAHVVCEASPDFSLLSPGLARIVKKATREVPHQRYGGTDDFAADLRRYLESPRAVEFRAALRRRTLWTSAGGLIVLLAALVVPIRQSPGQHEEPPPQYTPVAVTSLPGLAESPSLSPDGVNLSFVWNEGDASTRFCLYVQPLNGGKRRRLIQTRNQKWSPDGKSIAVLQRLNGNDLGVVLISPETGKERELVRIQGPSVYETDDMVAWTADGKQVAIAVRGSAQQPFSIMLISAETGAMRRLTSPPAASFGDVSSSFAPDGLSLAFVRCVTAENCDLYSSPVSGGQVHRLTWDQRRIDGLTWTPDSRDVVFSSYRARGVASLWRISAATRDVKEPATVAVLEGDAILPSISRPVRGAPTRLVFQHRVRQVNVWRSSIETAGGGPHIRITNAQTIADSPMFSPDGSRIAFSMDTFGNRDIWVANSDGSNAVRLTSMQGPFTDSPRWSPDGRSIAFTSASGDNRDIYVVSSGGGLVRRLTTEPSEEGRPSWSSNGRWIYFRSNRSGSRQIWKMRSNGEGTAIQITHGGGYEAFESLDGKVLYYAKGYEVPGVWSVPPEGGEERLVVRGAGVGCWGVSSPGIHFMQRQNDSPVQPIKLYRFSTDEVTEVSRIPGGDVPYGFSVSRDGRSLLWVNFDRHTSDIMKIDNFR